MYKKHSTVVHMVILAICLGAFAFIGVNSFNNANADYLVSSAKPISISAGKQVKCDTKYKPVCGSIKIQVDCIQAPCDATETRVQTYTNRCTLDAAKAKFLYNGVCR